MSQGQTGLASRSHHQEADTPQMGTPREQMPVNAEGHAVRRVCAERTPSLNFRLPGATLPVSRLFHSVVLHQLPSLKHRPPLPASPSSKGSCNKTAQVSLHLASSRLSPRGKPAHSPCTPNSSSANPYSNYMLSFSTNCCFAQARQLLLPGHVECSPSWQVAC